MRKHALAGLMVMASMISPAAADSAWHGAYVGANFGYSQGDWDSSSIASIFPEGLGLSARPNVDGPLAGALAGYSDWITSPIVGRWIFGVEADIQITAERAQANQSLSSNVLCCDDLRSRTTIQSRDHQWDFNWFATLRGRVGTLVSQETQLYLTGGLAIGGFRFASRSTTTTQLFDPAGIVPAGPLTVVAASAFSEETTRLGWTAGIGMTRKLSQRWSANFEYLYLDFGTHTFLAGSGIDTNVRLRDHIIRFAINYWYFVPGTAEH